MFRHLGHFLNGRNVCMKYSLALSTILFYYLCYYRGNQIGLISLFERLFTWAVCLKITEVAQILMLLFYSRSCVINDNGLGYILANYSHNDLVTRATRNVQC
jgi:hypothetical protein